MIITKTPFRISFTGGGTDIEDYYRAHGGAVVNTAIDKYIYITVNKRFDESIRVSYAQTEIVDEVAQLRHDIVRVALQMVGIDGGVEITSIADVPSGTGLGSSSSFTVGLLNALYTYQGYQLDAEELAERACRIEIDILGNPIGKQDQYAAAYGGLSYFQFQPNGKVLHQRIRISQRDRQRMDRKLVMLYTGIRRSANGILREQKQNIADRMAALDFMKRQADEMYRELTQNGFSPSFAQALDEGWKRKRSLTASISSGDIDKLYETAMAAGAAGGKLLGAGGGGFLLFYCDEERQDALSEALGLREMEFSLCPHGSRVVYFE